MDKQGIKKQLTGIILLFILMAVTFRIYLKGYSFRDLIYVLKELNYTFLIIGLFMMLIFVSCEAYNIRMIMNVLGVQLTFWNCFQYSCIGFYFSSITPSASGGQPAQVYYMKKDDIPIAMSSLTIFFIVFIYQFAMVSLGLIMLLLRYRTAIQFISRLKYLFYFGAAVNTGAIFLLFSLMFSKKLIPLVISGLFKLGKRLRMIKNADKKKEKLDNSLLSYHSKALLLKKSPLLFIKVYFVTMIQMVALSLIPAFIYISFGHKADGFFDLLTCQSLLTISVSAVPLPGAEGVSQGGFLRVFGMFFGKGQITDAMLINRTISFYIPLALCLFMYLFTHIRTSKMNFRRDEVDK